MFVQVRDKQPVLKVTGLQIKRSGFETGQCVVFLEIHFTVMVPLSVQDCKWVWGNCQGSLMKCWG